MDVEKAIEFILDLHAKNEASLASMDEKLEKTNAILRRAVRLGVREAPNERVNAAGIG